MGGPNGADYSSQWAEYYRSLGMNREAEMIEQQQGGAPGGVPPAAPAPAAAPQPVPQGGAGPDYSAQWAEYYRSIGKVKEAEAIEQQLRAKGPGGGAPQPAQPGYPGAGGAGGGGGPQYGGAPQGAFPPQPAGYYPPQQGAYPGYE